MHSVLTISYAFPGLNLQCISVSRAQADRQNMVQQQSLLENESLLTRKRKKRKRGKEKYLAAPSLPLVGEASFEDWLSIMLLRDKLVKL